jgi:hypothetical protein
MCGQSFVKSTVTTHNPFLQKMSRVPVTFSTQFWECIYEKRHAMSIPYPEHARSAHEIVLLWEIVYCMLTNIVGLEIERWNSVIESRIKVNINRGGV